MKKFLSVFLILLGFGLNLSAADFQYAVVYDFGKKFDGAFNEGVYRGVQQFEKDTGIKAKEFELVTESQSEQFLRQLARKKMDMIIVVGFSQISSLKKVAAEFPDTKFTLIDASLDMPNVQSIAFKEEEGSFLVGALAAMKTKSNKLGFIGGVDVPLIRKFDCGFRQGASYINSDIEFYQNMAGDTPDAWSNPAKGSELAISQIDRGVDVIYTAASKTSLGVLQAAADKQILAIGVDVNQNYLHPGFILSSMVKSLDLAAYNVLSNAKAGTWKPGEKRLGLKDKGVYWAYDEYNKPLITDAMKAKIDMIEKDIIAGKISIVDYMKTNSCEYSFAK